MLSEFDSLARSVPEENIEFWFARDLQEPLGYARWENSLKAITRAIESCETTGYDASDHFRGVTKLITRAKRSGTLPVVKASHQSSVTSNHWKATTFVSA